MMKGYMKKMKSKRVLALLVAALMVMTLMVPQTVSAASPDAVYTGGTKITELLTNYQYVIRNDAVLENHTVGAVAVGGKLNAATNTIGDGAQSPSYAKYILAANIGNGSGYGAATRDFYYGDSLNALPDDFTKNEGYMNLETIFGDATSGLIKQSADLAVGAVTYTCNENSAMGFPVIEITLVEDNMNIEIPYDELVKAKGINLNISDIDNLSKYAYTINITGVNGNAVMFEGEAWKGVAGEPSIDVFVNGKQYAFLGDMSGQVHGIECNLSGMKLIWNFPDATGNIEWSSMGGHVVAPQAGVKVTSGRFQGGIIANSFTGTGESHFYPYGEIDLDMLQSINITKKYVDADGNKVETTEQAVFGLFTDEDCKVPVKDTDGNAVTATVSASTGVASFPSESLGLDRTLEYYVKEISAPEGFEVNDTVYLCQFTAGGLVSYSELGKDGVPVYSLTSPVVENLKTSYATEEVGALIVTVLDKDTREVIEGVIIEVKDDNGTPIIILDGDGNIIDKTNANGVITYENIAQGEYTVTMTIPEGYVSNDEYSVEVDVQHTTYHTFELEQVKEPIIVYLKEEAEPNDKVTDGAWVQLQTKDENGNWVNASSAWTGSLGQVTFKDNVAGDYRVVLGSDPAGWNLVDTQTKEEVVIVAVSDGKDVNEHTFYFDKKVGDVEVTIYEYDKDSSTMTTDVIEENGASVTLTQADGTKLVVKDDGDGVVLFENVPIGDVTVELTTAPNGYLKPSSSNLTSANVTVTEGATANASLYAEKIATSATGNLIINTNKLDSDMPDADGVKFTITHPSGYNNNVTMTVVGEVTIYDLTPGDYIVELTTTPDGWKTTSTVAQYVTVPDGGEGKAEYVFTQTGDMEIIVVEKDSQENVGQAIVTVKDEDGKSVLTTTTTANNLTLKDLPVGDYTVTVIVPDGYVESGEVIDATNPNAASVNDKTITVTAGNTAEAKAELTLTRYGALTVTVVDKDNTSTVVPGVVVTVYDGANALVGGGTTNKDGQVVVEDLPAGSYTATYTKFASGSSSAQVYDLSTDEADNTEIATITATEDGKAQLEVIKATGDLTVIVKDEETGAPIKGAIVEITAPDGTKTEYTTDDSGKIELPDQDLGKYTVEVKDVPDDYNMPSQPKTNVTLDKDGEEVVKEVSKYVPGTLVVQIVDENGKIIEETATVTVESTTDGTEETLTNGVADCGTQIAGDYIVKIIEIPDEYELVYPTESAKTATVEDGKETVVKFVLKEIKYDLTVEVRDEDTNKVVPETTVQIIDKDTNEVVAETETDEKGKITVEVPKGDYIIKVTEVPDGYDNPSDDDTYVPKEVTVTEDTKEVVEFIGQTVIPPVTEGTLIIQVINQEGYVDGAVVTVDGDAKDITDGEITIPNLKADDYELFLQAIPVDHIVDPSNVPDRIATIVAGETTTVIYKLLQVAEVDITVKDEVTGEPIPDATVEVEIGTDPDGNPVVITGKTDENGEVTLDVPVKDDTTIKVTDVPEGYDEPDDQIIDVNPGNNKADFVVEPIGKVTVTVYDKLTGDVVPGAGVALLMHATGNSTEKYVSDASGNKLVLMTNTNGQATFDKLADGTYSAVVDSVPADYILAAVEGAADQATVTNGSHAYALHRLYAVGNMSITVVNKTTGQVVPNADVVVEGPIGDASSAQVTVNTGATGTIVLKDQIIGDYTLTAEDVKDCEFYGGVSNGNLSVEKGQTAEQKFEVVQTAGMTITVVDKETGDPIKDADITVTDPYGDAKDYTTDDNGQVTIPKQPVGENTVVINRVPSTNVLPDDTDETITTTVGGSNEVKIEAPKPSTEKGNLTITVVDQVTGAIVPGATVEIKDPSGNVMGTVITDTNGQIKYTDIATGKYTVTVQDVPSGYTKPTGDPTYVTVKVGDNAVKLEIKKPSASGGSGPSKPAPAPSTNTTVITNITVEKAPKTGDISYMPFAVAMMVISVLGLAGITVYRKKTESER